MPKVFQTARAVLDLEEVWLYIATDNTVAADRLLDEIGATALNLAQQPRMGRARPELAADLRSFPIGRYVLFYRPVVDGVQLVRVLHSARDIDGADFEQR